MGLPFTGNARQSKLMHAQVNYSHEKYVELWIHIIMKVLTEEQKIL